MCFPQRSTNLTEKVNDALRRKWPVPPNEFLQCEARKVFHGVEESAVVGVAVVVHLNGIRVSEPGGRFDFTREAVEECRIANSLRADHLHRTRTLQEPVFGQIHLTHATTAELPLEDILPELPSLLGLLSQCFQSVRAKNRKRSAA